MLERIKRFFVLVKDFFFRLFGWNRASGEISHFSIWGPRSSGKTTYLAALYKTVQLYSSEWDYGMPLMTAEFKQTEFGGRCSIVEVCRIVDRLNLGLSQPSDTIERLNEAITKPALIDRVLGPSVFLSSEFSGTTLKELCDEVEKVNTDLRGDDIDDFDWLSNALKDKALFSKIKEVRQLIVSPHMRWLEKIYSEYDNTYNLQRLNRCYLEAAFPAMLSSNYVGLPKEPSKKLYTFLKKYREEPTEDRLKMVNRLLLEECNPRLFPRSLSLGNDATGYLSKNQEILDQCFFPGMTEATEIDQYVFDLQDVKADGKATHFSFFDMAGETYASPVEHPGIYLSLANSAGLLFMVGYDTFSTPIGQFGGAARMTLNRKFLGFLNDWIKSINETKRFATQRLIEGQRLDIPVVICINKIEELIGSAFQLNEIEGISFDVEQFESIQKKIGNLEFEKAMRTIKNNINPRKLRYVFVSSIGFVKDGVNIVPNIQENPRYSAPDRSKKDEDNPLILVQPLFNNHRKGEDVWPKPINVTLPIETLLELAGAR